MRGGSRAAGSGFSALLEEVVREPERAFEELRALLFDAATALLTCPGVAEAQSVLEGFADHRFAPLLHHYQLSNWILTPGPTPPARSAPTTSRAAWTRIAAGAGLARLAGPPLHRDGGARMMTHWQTLDRTLTTDAVS